MPSRPYHPVPYRMPPLIALKMIEDIVKKADDHRVATGLAFSMVNGDDIKDVLAQTDRVAYPAPMSHLTLHDLTRDQTPDGGGWFVDGEEPQPVSARRHRSTERRSILHRRASGN